MKIHVALGVTDLERSVLDYSWRLGHPPCVVIPNQYALWRTRQVNFSVRVVESGASTLGHLGWEDPGASEFTEDVDVNGIRWEHFTEAQQDDAIQKAWPDVRMRRTGPSF
jgi:hypothetical protein